MRDAANELTLSGRTRPRRTSMIAVLSAFLGLATCVQTPAQEPAPRPMQALLAPSAPPAVPVSTGRPLADDLPTAVPVTAEPTAAPAAPEPVPSPTDERTVAVHERFHEIFWTAPEDTSADSLAGKWGIKFGTLAELNPGLIAGTKVVSGTKLRVYKWNPEQPTISIGSPNRGKLRNGMPLPEGPGWRLRVHRPRTFGTTHTIAALVDAFETYGRQYPDGPKIRVGEIAKRNGGRVPPHSSHRSGRDIDIGYIFHGIDDGEHRWKYMNVQNFDAEKNWALVQAILATDQVQTIYIAKKLQKLLHKEAAKHLSEAELTALFEFPRSPGSATATIQHWRGHANHMHVRFKCEPGNRRCRARQR